jgi:hypothetical protein
MSLSLQPRLAVQPEPEIEESRAGPCRLKSGSERFLIGLYVGHQSAEMLADRGSRIKKRTGVKQLVLLMR